MLLSEAALHTFVGEITRIAAFKMATAGCLLKPFLTRRLSIAYLQMLLSKAALPTVATASVTLDPIRASSLCWKDHKNSRVQNGDSRLPSKAFSDAAFIYVLLLNAAFQSRAEKPRSKRLW